MKYSLLAGALATSVSAFPQVLQDLGSPIAKRDFARPGCSVSKLCNTYVPISDEQAGTTETGKVTTDNCGLANGPCLTFDPETQYVSNQGEHRFIAPGKTDIRGPCPGLNAAANHGYLPRNGIATMAQTNGLVEMYGMGIDVAQFLAAYAIAFTGDPVTQTWSIGGPMALNSLTGLTGQPQGISFSHNNYEGDTSISRCDAYTNGGDAHSSSVTRYGYAYKTGMDNGDRYTLDTMARTFAANTFRSIQTNAMYFAPLFSTTIVAPAAYNFVVVFMSNHSAEEPAGYLTGEHFNTWWGMSGEYPNFKWIKGHERMPDNWYKRPVTNLYNAASVLADAGAEFAAYPNSFRFGGNTNGTNSYTGIDISNFTGGVYNGMNLFEGNNLACFFFQNQQQAVPQALKGLVQDVASASQLIFDNFPASIGSGLQCPEAAEFDNSVFDPYSGKNLTYDSATMGRQNC